MNEPYTTTHLSQKHSCEQNKSGTKEYVLHRKLKIVEIVVRKGAYRGLWGVSTALFLNMDAVYMTICLSQKLICVFMIQTILCMRVKFNVEFKIQNELQEFMFLFM
jgi:hypothetical protein